MTRSRDHFRTNPGATTATSIHSESRSRRHHPHIDPFGADPAATTRTTIPSEPTPSPPPARRLTASWPPAPIASPVGPVSYTAVIPGQPQLLKPADDFQRRHPPPPHRQLSTVQTQDRPCVWFACTSRPDKARSLHHGWLLSSVVWARRRAMSWRQAPAVGGRAAIPAGRSLATAGS
jgi:hypothetical protein